LLPDVVTDVCARAGVDADASALTGVVSGYAAAGPVSARHMLEPLVQAYAVEAGERETGLVFRPRGASEIAWEPGRLVEEDGPATAVMRDGLEQAEASARLRFID